MSPSDFITAYSAALASQSWSQVSPLIHPDAVVTFSTGAVHIGAEAIRIAYERNFSLIKSEDYRMSDVHWIDTGAEVAIYTFAYHWRGLIDGGSASGSGRGTAVIRHDNGQWRLIAEHLTRIP